MITLSATHQQTKKLIDAVNGTYQTVLTIDPSVGWSDIVGTYSCTVENVRGKSSETVVVPGEACSLTTRYTYILQSVHINVADGLREVTLTNAFFQRFSRSAGIHGCIAQFKPKFSCQNITKLQKGKLDANRSCVSSWEAVSSV